MTGVPWGSEWHGFEHHCPCVVLTFVASFIEHKRFCERGFDKAQDKAHDKAVSNRDADVEGLTPRLLSWALAVLSLPAVAAEREGWVAPHPSVG